MNIDTDSSPLTFVQMLELHALASAAADARLAYIQQQRLLFYRLKIVLELFGLKLTHKY